MQKVKGQPRRSGKQKQLADMAKAYAMQKWDHKLFKRIDPLQPERSQVLKPKELVESVRTAAQKILQPK